MKLLEIFHSIFGAIRDSLPQIIQNLPRLIYLVPQGFHHSANSLFRWGFLGLGKLLADLLQFLGAGILAGEDQRHDR